jgi:membrane protein implicated in regulation of membrane protease activity
MFPEPIQGITDRSIAYDQTGRVKFQGTYWSARLYQPSQQLIITPGELVSIIAIQGITLLVVPTGLE